MDQEAPDKLVSRKRHSFVAVLLFSAVILPLKSNVMFTEVDEPRVGDGDAVGVAGEVVKNSAWTGNGALASTYHFR